ncbi:MAG TPA: imidazolonepropionase [Bacteroidia bacterium]|nr:imidazolonepropionase [Bacteroidia bacterium]
MQKILIKNIKKLVQLRDAQTQKISGKEMDNLPCMDDAWLAIDNGVIADYGSMSDFPGIADWKDLQVIDASGKMVFPSWVDSHTHIVYAGSREQEFTDRIRGLSYEEIAQRGGGILNSSKKLQDASEEELLQQVLPRLHEIILQGTGAVEIKSGYGLSLESELKMLRVIKKIKELTKLTVKSTFLGAHAFPLAYKQNKRGYIDLIIKEMIPAVAEEKLAEFIDIFCEQNYFSFDETIEILEAGRKHGLTPKVHAEQMSHTGGVEAGVKCKAISVDHLEYVNEADIKLLLNSITMPTILPGAAYFVSLPNPPARQMIDAGLALAIASDFNPGTSPTGNMNLMQSIACIQYKLTPNEAINASTMNSAYAMQVEKELGSITIGKKANLFITKPIPSTDFISYSFGSNLVETVILNGEVYKG